jgi:hypothetical protein
MKRLLLNIFFFASMFVFTFPNPAKCSTISFGGLQFSDASDTVTFPQFNPSFGTLNSVIFEINDMTFSETVIYDVDDSLGPYYADDETSTWPIDANLLSSDGHENLPLGIGRTVLSLSYLLPAQGTISDDDGDGGGSHDGGVDEIVWSVVYPISSGSVTFEDIVIGYILDPDGPAVEINQLDYFKGSGSMSFLVGTLNLSLGPQFPRIIAVYHEDVTYAGDVNVQYNYSSVPLPSAALLFGSGLLSLIGFVRKFKK